MFTNVHHSPSPAEAGAQLRADRLAGASLNKFDLSNWAPAFAGEGKK
ncbi:MAG: hypothetical protein JWM65_2430 [Sphingomonas bacterium]|nr:hypothetical protein [Sphingomonas bacterium]